MHVATAMLPGDIESPPRVIEVKAFGGSARADGFLWLEVKQVEEGLRNPDFHLYIVEDVH